MLPAQPSIGEALRAGRISSEHARVIAVGVRRVPEPIRDTYVKELLGAAEHCDPSELARFSREVRSRLGGDESAEAAAQRQYASRWVSLHETFDGMHAISGMLDPVSAATVKTALAPLLAKLGPEDDRTVGQRRADGLVTLAELAMTTGTLPEHGGEKPQVVVTLPYLDLINDLHATGQPTTTLAGEPISAATARMIACDAGIIPAILGGRSEVLDLGRRTPTWSPAQRRALRIEDDGCRWPGCRVDLRRCRIHHLKFRSHGGATDIRNGAHLCAYHHWLVHHTNWTITKNHEGKIHVRRT